MEARNAQQQFEENLRLFGSTAEKEKFNLYAGLANLASELQSLRRDVQRLQQAIDRLQRR